MSSLRREISECGAREAARDQELRELRFLLQEQGRALRALRAACGAVVEQPSPTTAISVAVPKHVQQPSSPTATSVAVPKHSRSMLADIPSESGLACSADDIAPFLATGSNAVKAMADLLAANPRCATCVMPCAAKKSTSVFSAAICVVGCRHQDENRCDGTRGWGRTTALLAQASINDPASIVRIVQLVEKDCAMCVLETVSHVCGESCLRNGLHLITDYPVFSRLCAPDLAATLAAAQGRMMRATMDSAEPFGLHISESLTDLFVRTNGKLNGATTYHGVHSGYLMYRCALGSRGATGDIWAISSTEDANALGRCEGDLWVEVDTAQAHTGNFAVGLLGLRFVAGFEKCALLLRDENARRARISSYTDADTGAEVVSFADGVTGQEVACTMLWRLGPYWPLQQNSTTTRMVLPRAVGRIELIGDILVRVGETLILEIEEAIGIASSAATLVAVGKRQVQVEPGGKLAFVRMKLVDAVGGSALHNLGETSATNSTFERCSTSLNTVTLTLALPSNAGRSESDPPVPRVTTAAAGGAVLSFGDRALFTATGSLFLNCSASGSATYIAGGAISCVGGRVHLVRTMLRECFVGGFGDASFSGGGALSAVFAPSIEVVDSLIVGNQASKASSLDSETQSSYFCIGGAMWFSYFSKGNINGSTFVNNSATFNARGGAVAVGLGVNLDISRSVFRSNSALGTAATKLSRGGGLFVDSRGTANIQDTTFELNLAAGSQLTDGGAVSVFGSLTLGHEIVFQSNSVSGQGRLMGGAVAVRQDDPLYPPSLIGTKSPAFVANFVEGTGPEGGALFLQAGLGDTGFVHLWGAHFHMNAVETRDMFGRGGAIHVEQGSARLENCSFTANAALMKGGTAYDATGGAISIGASGSVTVIGARLASNTAGGTL
jgi:hypothetical protein